MPTGLGGVWFSPDIGNSWREIKLGEHPAVSDSVLLDPSEVQHLRKNPACRGFFFLEPVRLSAKDFARQIIREHARILKERGSLGCAL